MPGLSVIFRPFSYLYGFGVALRNLCFDAGVLPEQRFDVPIVTIGNLAVGGTGKTPHTEYIYRLLASRGKIAVLSRGYGRATKGFRMVTSASKAEECGDEPCQIKRKFPDAVVAVDANRPHGITRLMKSEQLAAVVLDDAYQHRYVKPDVNVLLTEYNHLYCDDHLLPEGHLREPMGARRRADIIIVTKCPPDLRPIDFQLLRKRTNPFASQHLFFTTQLYSEPYPLFGETRPCEGKKVLAVTGISNPSSLIAHLKERYEVTQLRFSDHHSFTEEEIDHINATFSGHDLLITTEKDATRLTSFASRLSMEVKYALFVQPVEVGFLRDDAATFKRVLEEHLFRVKY